MQLDEPSPPSCRTRRLQLKEGVWQDCSPRLAAGLVSR
ncbi:hypothetical protein I552_6782 [Mycobacterium xenopi 3993]|nr:hypothetical protein I552_6782 [Mycobacterium xenopi 3993]